MTDYHYDLPFDIMDVANLLGLKPKKPGGRSVYTNCPFCGDTRYKFNLNLAKNVFRCNYCGEHGGALALYGRVHGVSNQVAYQEISDILYGGGSNKAYEVRTKKKEKRYIPESSELASLFERNQTYEMMLSMLVLSSKHKENLLARGISEDHINKFEYRSTPVFGFDRIADALVNAGCIVEGIPGFYQKIGKQWSMNFKSACSGILVPVRSLSGMIQGFQIRLDHPFVDEKGRKTKYIWFSSIDYEKGVSSGGPAHFVGDPAAETVYVTEGALKADAAHSLSGKTFLAVPGAGNIKCLEEPFQLLKKNGTKNMYECLDQDKYVNEYVMKSSKNLVKFIKEFGFNTKIIRWDKAYKGVDDFLLAKQK